MGIRSIEFRGKTDNGEWVYGGICDYNSGVSIFVVHHYDSGLYEPASTDLDEIEVISKTVGQYTGLKDKNGTKIFEGDIVESRASENKEDWKYWQVIFYDGSYCFEREVKKRKYKYEQNLLCEDEVSLYGLVVVGNIHDNPELLEGVRE